MDFSLPRTSRTMLLVYLTLSALASGSGQTSPSVQTVTTPPASWVDPDTGHKVSLLTPEPDSRGLYFNENAFTSNGMEMIYSVDWRIYALNLSTHKTRKLVSDPVASLIVGRKSPTVYFMTQKQGDAGLYAVGVETGTVLKIADLPAHATISSLNADETMIAGVFTEGEAPKANIHPDMKERLSRAAAMDQRLDQHLPTVLFTFDLRTGQLAQVLHSTDWLGHVQFSPTDPSLLMYCHEGLWQRVDRIWTVQVDGSHNALVHKRTMNNEIAGHEFWDADGKTIWYDLQAPKGQTFYLASYNVESKARTWYSIDRDDWSIHYNSASDDSVFAGDGGDYSQVAKSKNGQWIELFFPRKTAGTPGVDQTDLVQSGFMKSQHLVNLAKHNYTLEPNVRFSPDHKLVIFTSNMFGPSYIFAVEVRHARPASTPITPTQ